MSEVKRCTKIVRTGDGGSAFENAEIPLREQQQVADGVLPMFAGALPSAAGGVPPQRRVRQRPAPATAHCGASSNGSRPRATDLDAPSAPRQLRTQN
jgi:hypothetical protein